MSEQRQINPWLIAVSVMLATFMEVLDTTVVNVSLPHIAGSLSVTIDEATWALTLPPPVAPRPGRAGALPPASPGPGPAGS